MRGLLALLGLAVSLLAASARAEDRLDAPADEARTGAAHEPSAHGAHGDGAEGHGAHGVPTFDDINWFYGMIGEREGVEPGLAYRPTGMPAPYGAWILNAALLYFVIYRFAKQPLANALRSRKDSILRGMTEASRMKEDAGARLADYESKLERIDQDIERVKKEMREAARVEREAVLAEARARRERMERDARLLVEQELAAARESMKRDLVTQALSSAAETLQKRLTDADGQRLAEEYLVGIKKAGESLRVRS
jgi:F-type H+-transporting ATPase subunit b